MGNPKARPFCEGMDRSGRPSGYFLFSADSVITNYDLFVSNVRSALGKHYDPDAGLICSIALLVAEHEAAMREPKE